MTKQLYTTKTFPHIPEEKWLDYNVDRPDVTDPEDGWWRDCPSCNGESGLQWDNTVITCETCHGERYVQWTQHPEIFPCVGRNGNGEEYDFLCLPEEVVKEVMMAKWSEIVNDAVEMANEGMKTIVAIDVRSGDTETFCLPTSNYWLGGDHYCEVLEIPANARANADFPIESAIHQLPEKLYIEVKDRDWENTEEWFSWLQDKNISEESLYYKHLIWELEEAPFPQDEAKEKIEKYFESFIPFSRKYSS